MAANAPGPTPDKYLLAMALSSAAAGAWAVNFIHTGELRELLAAVAFAGFSGWLYSRGTN